MKSIFKALAVFTSLFVLAGQANAVLSVKITDGTAANTFIGTDADGDGVVSLITPAGGFALNLVSGFGAPTLGGIGFDNIHLNSVNLSSLMSGGDRSSGQTQADLWVYLTQTDLTRSPANFSIGVGGVAGGMVSFQSFIDSSNSAFGTATQVSSLGGYTGAFSGTDSGSTAGAGPQYSWTTVAHIRHGAGNVITSFDYNVRIPEPHILGLLGIGLVGFGVFARNRRRSTR